MGVRVDRQAALGWLGIDGYRPSGRVPLPAGKRGLDAGEVDELPASDLDDRPLDGGQDIAGAESADAPARPVAADMPESTTPAAASPAEPAAGQPASSGEEAILPESAAAPPADRLCVTADSPHRDLAGAIARVAGLACETGADSDALTLGGEDWVLSTLAGDGQAKRRLWRVLVDRARRPRA